MVAVFIFIACVAFAAAGPMPEVLELVDADQARTEGETTSCQRDPLNSLSQNARSTFLNDHNNKRRSEGVGLPDMTWDNELAEIAQTLTNRCVFRHDLLYKCDGSRMGQNLYYVGGRNFNAMDAMNNWYNEKSDYDYNSNTCRNVCGHYTQIVWRGSTRVGCAVTDCTGRVSSYVPEYIAACNYFPAGNISGQRPY